METVNWFFNGDFEDKLQKEDFNVFESNKANQEFEYFINFLNPTSQIYSLKKYDKEFCDFFKSFTVNDFKYNQEKKNIKFWCNDFSSDIEILKYQSKVEFYRKMNELELIPEPFTFIQSTEEVEAGYLYKHPMSLSGMGHLKAEINLKKIKTILDSGITLIKEKELDRAKDFSSLFEESKHLVTYENIVDKYFGYKGTIIDNDFCLESPLDIKYKKTLKEISELVTPYLGVFSIDSFLYKKDGQIHLFPACEINLRKTMGYFTYKFKERYFSNSKCFVIRLIKNKKKTYRREDIQKNFQGRVIPISPLGNLFSVICFNCNNRDEFESMEKELLLKFF